MIKNLGKERIWTFPNNPHIVCKFIFFFSINFPFYFCHEFFHFPIKKVWTYFYTNRFTIYINLKNTRISCCLIPFLVAPTATCMCIWITCNFLIINGLFLYVIPRFKFTNYSQTIQSLLKISQEMFL